MVKQEINVDDLEIRTTYLIFGGYENKVRHTTLVISRRTLDYDRQILKEAGDWKREDYMNMGRYGKSDVLGRGKEY